MKIMMLFLRTVNEVSINNIKGTEYSVICKYLTEVKRLPVCINKELYSVFDIPENGVYSKLYVVNGNDINLNILNSEIHFLAPTDFSIVETISELVMWMSHTGSLQIDGKNRKCKENMYSLIEVKSLKIYAKCVRGGSLGLFIEGIPDRFFREINEKKGS